MPQRVRILIETARSPSCQIDGLAALQLPQRSSPTVGVGGRDQPIRPNRPHDLAGSAQPCCEHRQSSCQCLNHGECEALVPDGWKHESAGGEHQPAHLVALAPAQELNSPAAAALESLTLRTLTDDNELQRRKLRALPGIEKDRHALFR